MAMKRRPALTIHYWVNRRVCVTHFRGAKTLPSFVGVIVDGRQVFYAERV